MPFKTTLEAALAYLKAKGIIKFDSDIMDPLGIRSKGTVSNYASGKAVISEGFKEKFENYYKIKLNDFEDEVLRSDKKNNPDQDDQDYQKKYIKLLEDTLKEKGDLTETLDQIKFNLKQIPDSMVWLTERAEASFRQEIGRLEKKIESLNKSRSNKA